MRKYERRLPSPLLPPICNVDWQYFVRAKTFSIHHNIAYRGGGGTTQPDTCFCVPPVDTSCSLAIFPPATDLWLYFLS